MKKKYQSFKPYYKESLKLAVPVMISQLGNTLVHAADTVIVGQFAGTHQLAAVSLGTSLFVVVLVMGIGISYGLTPLIAQENGSKNYKECGRLLSNSLLINIVSGILLFCLVYYGSLFAIDRLNQQPQVIAHARPFIKLLGISIIPLMVFNTFKQFAEGLGFTRQAMTISIWGNVINIIVGIILVKGLFGIEPMGVRGVGWSTLLDRCLMAVAMGIFVFKADRFKPYLSHFRLLFFDKVRTIRILKIGMPTALQYVFEVSAFSAAALMMGTIGAVEQAAHQVAINMAAITYMMASGIAAAATIKTGNMYGGKNFIELRRYAVSSYHIVLVFMALTAFLFIGGNNLLPWIYTSDVTVIVVAARLLVFAGLFQLFDGAQVVGLGILRGLGDVNVPTLITFLAYWVVGLPLAYVLGIYWQWGADGIWIGLTFGLLVSAVFLYWRFNRQSKKLLVNKAIGA